MSAVVVDAWAALALLQGERPAAEVVRRYLRRAKSGQTRLLMTWINLGEVYYRVAQLRSEEHAQRALALIRALPIELLPAREAMVLEAAGLKARHRLSYADAFAVAAARLERAAVLTGDPEIISLPPGVVAVRRLDRSQHDRA